MSGDDKAEPLRCSFCNKEAFLVRQLVAGPKDIFICDECIEVCVEMITLKENKEPPPQATGPRWGTGVRCGLCRMPCSGEDVLLLEDRGILCKACVSEVERLSAEEKWARYK